VPLTSPDWSYPHGGRLRVYRTRDRGGSGEALERGLADACRAALPRVLSVEAVAE
jgi:hypothetical protein